MGVLDLRRDGSVYILTMIDEQNSNTFTPEVFDEHHRIIDEIEATRENCSVVLTSGDRKSWCQGINLQWLGAQSQKRERQFKAEMDRFLTRWALVDFPTVGCLTGHTFAGGAILASAMDFRLMREDRGWFCFSEVDVRIPFTYAMHEVVELLPNPQALRDLLLTGKRIGGGEAVKLGVVDRAYPQETLLEKSMELARMLAEKDRETYGTIKRRMRRNIVAMQSLEPDSSAHRNMTMR